tara:strand:+ start:2034 stop:2222 length:189 start_codon:yes stop_codon:yes gene_type:complete
LIDAGEVLQQRRFISFEDFVSFMYVENTVERRAWGEKPFKSANAYLKRNREFLMNQYLKYKA